MKKCWNNCQKLCNVAFYNMIPIWMHCIQVMVIFWHAVFFLSSFSFEILLIYIDIHAPIEIKFDTKNCDNWNKMQFSLRVAKFQYCPESFPRSSPFSSFSSSSLPFYFLLIVHVSTQLFATFFHLSLHHLSALNREIELHFSKIFQVAYGSYYPIYFYLYLCLSIFLTHLSVESWTHYKQIFFTNTDEKMFECFSKCTNGSKETM